MRWFCLWKIFVIATNLLKFTVSTLGISRCTEITTKKNHSMMCYLFILIWDKSFKKFWSLKWLSSLHNAQAIANTMYMSIYRNHWLMIKNMKNHFCSFLSNSREFYEFILCGRNYTISLSENLCCFPEISSFGFIETNRFDWLLKVFKAHLKNIIRLFNFLEKWSSNFIDLFIGSLCWKCNSNEKLKTIIKIKLGLSVGIKFKEIRKNLIKFFGGNFSHRKENNKRGVRFFWLWK